MTQIQKINFVLVLAALTLLLGIYTVFQINEVKELEEERWQIAKKA